MSLLVFKVKNINGREISSKKPLEIFNTKDAKVWNEVPMVSLTKEVSYKSRFMDSFDRSTGIILIFQLI
jgi:molybdopterin-containing oxidoreductase family iron-sulfur binding subunit